MAKREIVVELQLSDKNAVAELGKLEADTKKYQRALKDLYAEIKKGGGDASRSQQEAVGVLSAAIRRNQSVIRELRNDLSGATAAGLRFRDKMAEASQAGLASFGLQAVSVAAVTTAVITLAKEMNKLAGEIELTDARNRAIAGDSLPAFQQAAERTANSIGLTQREYVSLAATQALRLKQLGIEGDLLEELSIQTVEYADQLGDFSAGTLSTQDAAKLLNDALTGQTKGLKELGINVKASKEEIAALANTLMESRGLTEEQATAVATLQLAFAATADTMKVFEGQTLAIDAAQDKANARMKEAREAFAVALTPAITAATEASARYIDSIADFVSDGGAFRKFIAVISAGASESALAGFKAVFGDAEEAVKSTVEEVKKAPEALQGTIDAFEVVGTKTRSIGELREKLKGLKEAREELLETDKAGLDANAKEIASLEARIKALDGSTASTVKKTEAVKKLTAAQLAQIDAENAIRSDARENIFAQTGGGTETPSGEDPCDPKQQTIEERRAALGMYEENIEEVTVQYAELNRLRTEFQDQQIQGIFDYNTQKALIEQEHLQGNLRNYADYQAALADLDRMRLQNQMQNAQAIAGIFGNLASVYDEASAEYKAFATIQTLINTYMSATAAFNALASIPYVGPVLGVAAAAAAVAAGLANVAKIQGFEEGGFTSKRSRDDAPVGVVHANEYVVPAPLLRTPKGKRLVDELERMRLGHPVRYAAPYISGGSTVRFMRGTGLAPVGVSSSDIRSADLTRALMMMPTPVVRVDEINRVQRRVNVIDSLSTA